MKYFVVSDIHSFATEFKKALKQAGFRKNNPEHILIVVGDFADRGESVLDTYKFIKSIPKSRRILIKGNHEYLYLDLLDKKYPEGHDFSNRTVDTFCQIANMQYFEDAPDISVPEYLESGYSFYSGTFYDTEKIDQDCQNFWNEIKEKVRKHPITRWLKSKEWKNYYELDKYIFVHSFIPLHDSFELSSYYINGHNYSYDPDWRAAIDARWEDATWGCPWKLFKDGWFDEEAKNGKVLVCGHWHTGDFYAKLNDNFKYHKTCGPIYFSKNLIGLDGGVCYDHYSSEYVHPQNVLVIDENFDCFDKFGKKLN